MEAATFLRETLFLRVEAVFWLVEIKFFHFSDTPASEGNFCLAKTCFRTNFSFRRVETDFMSCGDRFLLFNLFFLQEETFIEISGNKFIWERLCSGRKGCAPSGDCFLLFCACFPLVETVTETS